MAMSPKEYEKLRGEKGQPRVRWEKGKKGRGKRRIGAFPPSCPFYAGHARVREMQRREEACCRERVGSGGGTATTGTKKEISRKEREGGCDFTRLCGFASPFVFFGHVCSLFLLCERRVAVMVHVMVPRPSTCTQQRKKQSLNHT